jgi:hypothetical protein
MPDERLKFRCYRCNQLLGAPAKKVGSVVSCPRCKAELKVPVPDEQAAEVEAGEVNPGLAAPRARDDEARASQGVGNPLPSFMEEIAAAIPDDLATLRPEDIRVEANFVDLVVTTSEPAAAVAVPAEPTSERSPVAPTSERSPVAPVPTELPPATPAPSAGPPPELAPTVPKAAPIVPTLNQPVDTAPGSALPAINIEPPSILPPGREFRTAQEVVLQPATVLAWSLLVLIALPMAFIAGLLIGHFIWR